MYIYYTYTKTYKIEGETLTKETFISRKILKVVVKIFQKRLRLSKKQLLMTKFRNKKHYLTIKFRRNLLHKSFE